MSFPGRQAFLPFFRLGPRGHFLLQFDLIAINRGTDEIFQGGFIDLVALEKIDRSSRVAFEARVEELVRIWEARPVGKGKLHLPYVGVGDRDDSVVRPHRASHPLPFLDYLPVGLKDALADAGERFAPPVCEFCDQLVNTFRWTHWIFMPRMRCGGAPFRRGLALKRAGRLQSARAKTCSSFAKNCGHPPLAP